MSVRPVLFLDLLLRAFTLYDWLTARIPNSQARDRPRVEEKAQHDHHPGKAVGRGQDQLRMCWRFQNTVERKERVQPFLPSFHDLVDAITLPPGEPIEQQGDRGQCL